MYRSSLRILALTVVSCAVACGPGESKKVEQVPMVTVANELAALSRLRSLVTAERNCQIATGGYASLDDLVKKGYIGDPSGGRLSGYRFDISVSAGGFEITAVPQKYGITGKRSFYVDQSNVTRAADRQGSPATSSDPEA